MEGLGYDVVNMADHLYTTAPFPMMTALALATEKLRVGTFVLNAGFYRPALLGRDVTSLRDLSGGRLELGLGAGYAKEEFEQAELPYPTAGQRVAWLGHVIEHMNEHASDVPILVAGNGDKLLTIAAQRADIIGLTGGIPITADADPLADRIEFVRNAAPDRFDDLELNISVIGMPTDDSGVADVTRWEPLTAVSVMRNESRVTPCCARIRPAAEPDPSSRSPTTRCSTETYSSLSLRASFSAASRTRFNLWVTYTFPGSAPDPVTRGRFSSSAPRSSRSRSTSAPARASSGGTNPSLCSSSASNRCSPSTSW